MADMAGLIADGFDWWSLEGAGLAKAVKRDRLLRKMSKAQYAESIGLAMMTVFRIEKKVPVEMSTRFKIFQKYPEVFIKGEGNGEKERQHDQGRRNQHGD